MRYTLWTRGQKVGETRLELHPSPRRRTGAFYPTEFGRTVIPALASPTKTGEVELRDPTGALLEWESLAINDIEQLFADARARRPDLPTTAPAALGDPIRYVISLTVPEHREAAADRDAYVSAR